jgi:hypothetical protein
MTIRRTTAGFLAGASSVFGLLLIVMLLLLGAGMAGMIRDLTLPQNRGISFGQMFVQTLGATLAALPGYFWSARWAFLTLGLLGVVLAVTDALRPRIQRPWRDYAGLVVAVGFAGFGAFAFVFAGRSNVAGWLVTQPALFNERELLLDTSWIPLLLGLLITIALAFTILATWAWWYDRWARWLHVQRPISVEAEREQVSARVADVYDYRPRSQSETRPQEGPPAADIERARRRWVYGSLVGLAAGLLLFWVFASRYASSGAAITSGELFVNTESPANTVALVLPRAPRGLQLSNPGGSGSVDVVLIDQAGVQVLPQQSFELGGSATNIVAKQIDLQGLAPGAYRLDLRLGAGDGGLVRYVALYGGGGAALADALLASLAAGIALASGTILALELVVREGRVS